MVRLLTDSAAGSQLKSNAAALSKVCAICKVTTYVGTFLFRRNLSNDNFHMPHLCERHFPQLRRPHFLAANVHVYSNRGPASESQVCTPPFMISCLLRCCFRPCLLHSPVVAHAGSVPAFNSSCFCLQRQQTPQADVRGGAAPATTSYSNTTHKLTRLQCFPAPPQ